MIDADRRRALGQFAVIGTASLAGCSGLLGDGGSGGGEDPIPSYASWVPASVANEGWEYGVSAVDVDRFKQELPPARSRRFRSELTNFADALGVDEGQFDAVVEIDEAGAAAHTVVTGSFDVDAIQERLDRSFEGESYRGYTVLGSTVALSEGAVVSSPDFERVIDAREGVTERLHERYEEWERVLRDAGEATMSAASRDPGERYRLLASTVTSPDGEALEIVGHAHFPDAEAAETYAEEVPPAMNEYAEDIHSMDVTNQRVDGDVVVVEARSTEYDF